MNKHLILQVNLSPTRLKKTEKSDQPFLDHFIQHGMKLTAKRRMSRGSQSKDRGLTKSTKSLRSTGKNETAGIAYVPLRDFALKKQVFKGTFQGMKTTKAHDVDFVQKNRLLSRKTSFAEVKQLAETKEQTKNFQPQFRRANRQLNEYDVQNILADYERERRAQNISSFHEDLQFFKEHYYDTHQMTFKPKKKPKRDDNSDTVSTKMRKVRIKMALSQRSDKINKSRAQSGRSFASKSSGKSEKMYESYAQRKDLWTLIASVICCDRSDYYLKWLVKKLTDDEEYQALRQPKNEQFSNTEDRKRSNLRSRKKTKPFQIPDSAQKLMDYLMRQKRTTSKSRDPKLDRIPSATLLPYIQPERDRKTALEERNQPQKTSRESKAIAKKRLQVFFDGVQDEIKKKIAVTPLNNRQEQLMIQHARRNLARLKNITKNQFDQLSVAKALRTSSKFKTRSNSLYRDDEGMAAFLVNLLGVDEYKPLRMVYSTKILPINNEKPTLQINQTSIEQKPVQLSPQNLKHYVTHADLARSPSLQMDSLRQKPNGLEQRQLPRLSVDLEQYKPVQTTTLQKSKPQAQHRPNKLPIQTNIVVTEKTSSPSVQFEEFQLRPSQKVSKKGPHRRLISPESEVIIEQAQNFNKEYYAKKQQEQSKQLES